MSFSLSRSSVIYLQATVCVGARRFEFWPAPPPSIKSAAILLQEVDAELCQHLEACGLCPGEHVVWPILSRFLVSSLPADKWAHVWDELLLAAPMQRTIDDVYVEHPMDMLCVGVTLAAAMRDALFVANGTRVRSAQHSTALHFVHRPITLSRSSACVRACLPPAPCVKPWLGLAKAPLAPG